MNSDKSNYNIGNNNMKNGIRMRSPLKWYGGKAKILKELLLLIPPHGRYVEVCGGAGQVLFAKQPVEEEVLNDVDPNLMNFWRILKTPNSAVDLISRLEKTPNTREHYALCQQQFGSVADDIERARQFFVLVRQSFNGTFSAGWSRPSRPSDVKAFQNAVARLPAAHRRLRSVTLENLDFRGLLPKYDGPHVLYYIDPPYLLDTRTAKSRYKHEMTDADHRDLLNAIQQLKGMVILSGYAHPMYDQALSNWKRIEISVVNHAAQTGRSQKTKKIEVIWLNPACSLALGHPVLRAVSIDDLGAVPGITANQAINTKDSSDAI